MSESSGWFRGPEQTWAVDPCLAGEEPREAVAHAWRERDGERRTACAGGEDVVFTDSSVFDPAEAEACPDCVRLVTTGRTGPGPSEHGRAGA
ncbi:hypothetical protein [Actinomadura flavalba]|uniref:hypothetical protein n=1 Tax=Actinomadura flavalba TaxID=1120938 RepID=UPI0012DF217E|nr:hypothetical protein [Actinomadura flavalba]